MTLTWAIRAVQPGDTLYVVGDAPAVRKGVGAYRGEREKEIAARPTWRRSRTWGTRAASMRFARARSAARSSVLALALAGACALDALAVVSVMG